MFQVPTVIFFNSVVGMTHLPIFAPTVFHTALGLLLPLQFWGSSASCSWTPVSNQHTTQTTTSITIQNFQCALYIVAHCCFSLDQIAQARRKAETAKDLEGMDMDNVIQGSRRRGRSADDTPVSPPNKKQRGLDTQERGSGSESSEDDGSGSAYEDSEEEEFQLSAQ